MQRISSKRSWAIRMPNLFTNETDLCRVHAAVSASLSLCSFRTCPQHVVAKHRDTDRNQLAPAHSRMKQCNRAHLAWIAIFSNMHPFNPERSTPNRRPICCIGAECNMRRPTLRSAGNCKLYEKSLLKRMSRCTMCFPSRSDSKCVYSSTNFRQKC